MEWCRIYANRHGRRPFEKIARLTLAHCRRGDPSIIPVTLCWVWPCNFNRQLLKEEKNKAFMLSVNGIRVVPFDHGKPMKWTEQLQAPLAIYHKKAGDNMRRVCLSRGKAYPCLLSWKPNKKIYTVWKFQLGSSLRPGRMLQLLASPLWAQLWFVPVQHAHAKPCVQIKEDKQGPEDVRTTEGDLSTLDYHQQQEHHHPCTIVWYLQIYIYIYYIGNFKMYTYIQRQPILPSAPLHF